MHKVIFIFLSMIAVACGSLDATGPLSHWTLQQEGSDTRYEVTVPCSVAGALNQAGALGKDILDQDRYQKLDRAPFDSPWVFTTRFKAKKDQCHVLRFEGLNFYADIELNGVKIASADTTYGTFSVREFDVTALTRRDNTLKVTLRRAQSGDLNHGFVDWNPRPLDESMGILRPVTLISTPDVQVQDVFVKPLVDPAHLSQAKLEIAATLVNRSAEPVEGVLNGKYDSGAFSVPVQLAAGATRTVKVVEEVENPRLWWTREMGSPEMYHLDVAFEKDGRVSHCKGVDFGIRSIEGVVDAEGHRQFILNGRKVLIKAGGWTDDIFFQDTPESVKAQMDLVCDMGLNCIRFENIWSKDDYVYDLCDRTGILALVGWSCQWEWEDYCGLPETSGYGCINDPRSEAQAVRYFHDQVIRLRNHPSLIGWLTGSDRIPNERLEKEYLALYEKLDYRPYVCSAKGLTSLAGPSGMKMEGPYEYVGPDYWYIDKKNGGAFGFNTETGPGLSLPQLESLRRMVGEKDLWPIGPNWAYHCTASASHMNSTAFQEKVMEGIYGKADSLEDYVRKAHALDYDAERGMFEAFRCNLPHTTGIVQWMLNSAWPSLYWQLYDWYGIPTAGYFGVKNALRPVQLVYNYADACVYAVNDAVPEAAVEARLRVYDAQGKLVREERKTVTSREREPQKVFDKIIGPCFVALELSGDTQAENFYTLPEKGNAYNWEESSWWGIPFLGYCDLRFVSALRETTLDMQVEKTADGYDVTLANNGSIIAYQNCLKARNEAGELIPGTFWEDNFFTVLPGETRRIHCTLPAGCSGAEISLTGWNASAEPGRDAISESSTKNKKNMSRLTKNEKNMRRAQFKLLFSGNAPELYPTETFFGLLYFDADDCLAISKHYPFQGEWGRPLGTELLNREWYPVPGLLDMVWLSVVERKFYSIQEKLPVEKMERLFSMIKPAEDTDDEEESLYQYLVVGMAPYGGVALWAYDYEKSTLVKWMHAEEVHVDMKDFHPTIKLDELCDFYINNDESVKEHLTQNGLPPRDLYDRYMQQFTYRYVVQFGHWDREKSEWRDYENGETRPGLDYIEESLFDGTHDKLHDGGLLNYHEAGKPEKLALQFHIGNTEYSAYFWMDDLEIRSAFEDFYREHPGARMDFVFRIDPEEDIYQMAFLCDSVGESRILKEETCQFIVFKDGLECCRSNNYNQVRGAWIW